MAKQNELFVLTGGRELLLDALRGTLTDTRRAVAVSDGLELGRLSRTLCFVWDSRAAVGRTPPQSVVGPSEGLDDLLAWAAAYLKPFSPLSSLIRLVPTETAERYFDDSTQPHPLEGLSAACVGLVLGEVSGQAGRVVNGGELSLGGCFSTLSFALLRGAGATSPADLGKIPELWLETRKLLDQQMNRLSVQQVAAAFRCLLRLEDPEAQDDSVVRVLRAVHAGQSPQMSTLGSIGKSLPLLADVLAMPVEERVKQFDRLAPEIIRDSSQERGLALGLAAALCRPGAFEMVHLLAPYMAHVPESALWFGLIQGLVPGGQIFLASDGLGWRVWRDASRTDHLRSRSSCDVSVRELRMLGRHRSGLELLRHTKSEVRTRLVVELLPGLSLPFRVGHDGGHKVVAADQPALFEQGAESSLYERILYLEERLSRASEFVQRAHRELDDVSRKSGGPKGRRR